VPFGRYTSNDTLLDGVPGGPPWKEEIWGQDRDLGVKPPTQSMKLQIAAAV